MEIAVLTDSGCEDACALEIGRWIKAKTATRANTVTLECSLMDAVLLAYHLQTARRVLITLARLKDIEEIEDAAIDEGFLRQFLGAQMTFKAEGEILQLRTDAQDMTPPFVQPLVEAVGGRIHRLGNKVSLTKPDIVIFASQTPDGITIGVDVAGRSLAKRDWRVMLSRRSLKATVAAATALYAGVKKGQRILDPFGDDGTIAIETAMLLSRTSPRKFSKDFSFERFPALAGTDWKAWRRDRDAQAQDIPQVLVYSDSLRDMKAVRTNAKLAGVDKLLHSTKVAVDWVETKIDERTMDRIITAPMPSGKSLPERKALKAVDDLFFQAEFVLKKGATITCITEKPDELLPSAGKYGFTMKERRDIHMGMRRMAIMTLRNAGGRG